MNELFERLAAPFPVEQVSWRVGNSNKKKRQRELNDNSAKATKGQALAYLDARDVMDRLDEVCGPEGWQNDYPHANGKTVCRIGILVPDMDQWVWKSDGAGDSDFEAEKGALSDAFKRAAVRFGIGRYLYGVSSPWVELDEWEQIKSEELKNLENLLQRHGEVIEWGTPSERASLRTMSNLIKNVCHTADDVRQFREQNEGNLAILRVKARGHIYQLLDRIAESAEAKAA